MNFRIMRHEDGTLSFVDPPGQMQEMEEKEEFTTLEGLIKWHLHNKVCVCVCVCGWVWEGGRRGGGMKENLTSFLVSRVVGEVKLEKPDDDFFPFLISECFTYILETELLSQDNR